MAPTYKFIYFNVTGLGEVTRLLFHYGGIEFEDVRIEDEQWPALKPTIPFGQLPILEHKGKTYYQSRAISRYVAKQVELTGKNDLEDMEIDATVDIIADVFQKSVDYYYEADKKIRKDKEERYLNEMLPFYIGKLEKQAQINNGYLVNGRLTWADLQLSGASEYMNFMAGRDVLAASPNLKALKELVYALPGIKEYISKRPNVP